MTPDELRRLDVQARAAAGKKHRMLTDEWFQEYLGTALALAGVLDRRCCRAATRTEAYVEKLRVALPEIPLGMITTDGLLAYIGVVNPNHQERTSLGQAARRLGLHKQRVHGHTYYEIT